MKVFIKADEFGGEKPRVVALYADDAVIPDNAHGDGMTIVHVPMDVIEKKPGELPSLAKDWRERAGTMPTKVEAKRRIEDAFSISDQLSSLHDMVEAVIKHGTDMSKWPADVKMRKVAFDEKWKYVADVQAKAREHAAAPPREPSNDKAWPRRLAKKT